MRFALTYLTCFALALLVASQPQSGLGCSNEQQASGCSTTLSASNCYNSTNDPSPYCGCFPAYFTCLQGAGCSTDGALWRGQLDACQQMNCTRCTPGSTNTPVATGTPGSTPRSADAISLGASVFALFNGLIMYLVW